LGKPIPIELHHKNGDHYDNSLDNLEILCPNCHAQEDNNSGAALKHKE
jgi:5-methylcytosine-specific restriction endonuclease McrA